MVHLNPDEATIEKTKREQKFRRYMRNSHRVKITIRTMPSIAKKFKKKLLYADMTMNDFFNDIMVKYIEKEETEESQQDG